MMPQNITSLNEINSNRVITIEFSDATYILKEFDYSGRTLTLNFIFNNTKENVTEPYENRYSLNAFKIKGRISKIKINMPDEDQPMHS